MISKTEEYALHAGIHLARQYDVGSVRSSTLAEVADIPPNYLSKVLHQLSRHGVVTSERGRLGGFRLSRDPASITLADLLAPFAPRAGRARCVLGREECLDEDPCPAHEHWKDAKRLIGEFFANTTLGDVVASEETNARSRGPRPDSKGVQPLTATGGRG